MQSSGLGSDYMEKVIIEKMNLDKLQKSINELRDVLNEICASTEETENSSEKLYVSQCLDKLIVEYMNKINRNTAEDLLSKEA